MDSYRFLKISHVLAVSFFLHYVLSAQTASELLCLTEDTYRRFSNYVDQGEWSREIYSDSHVYSSFTYFLAADRNKNVYHWINEFKWGKTQLMSYLHHEKDTMGTYTRPPDQEGPFQCSIFEAAARLVATGGGILLMTGSLLYDDFLIEVKGDASIMQLYDTANRLPDTSINGQPCYVVETSRTYMYTQKMADDSDRRRDSILALHAIPTEIPRNLIQPVKTQPGPRTSRYRYFIRRVDYLIIRQEELRFDPAKLTSKTVLQLNPRYNVEDFEQFLKF